MEFLENSPIVVNLEQVWRRSLPKGPWVVLGTWPARCKLDELIIPCFSQLRELVNGAAGS